MLAFSTPERKPRLAVTSTPDSQQNGAHGQPTLTLTQLAHRRLDKLIALKSEWSTESIRAQKELHYQILNNYLSPQRNTNYYHQILLKSQEQVLDLEKKFRWAELTSHVTAGVLSEHRLQREHIWWKSISEDIEQGKLTNKLPEIILNQLRVRFQQNSTPILLSDLITHVNIKKLAETLANKNEAELETLRQTAEALNPACESRWRGIVTQVIRNIEPNTSEEDITTLITQQIEIASTAYFETLKNSDSPLRLSENAEAALMSDMKKYFIFRSEETQLANHLAKQLPKELKRRKDQLNKDTHYNNEMHCIPIQQRIHTMITHQIDIYRTEVLETRIQLDLEKKETLLDDLRNYLESQAFEFISANSLTGKSIAELEKLYKKTIEDSDNARNALIFEKEIFAEYDALLAQTTRDIQEDTVFKNRYPGKTLFPDNKETSPAEERDKTAPLAGALAIEAIDVTFKDENENNLLDKALQLGDFNTIISVVAYAETELLGSTLNDFLTSMQSKHQRELFYSAANSHQEDTLTLPAILWNILSKEQRAGECFKQRIQNSEEKLTKLVDKFKASKNTENRKRYKKEIAEILNPQKSISIPPLTEKVTIGKEALLRALTETAETIIAQQKRAALAPKIFNSTLNHLSKRVYQDKKKATMSDLLNQYINGKDSAGNNFTASKLADTLKNEQTLQTPASTCWAAKFGQNTTARLIKKDLKKGSSLLNTL